MPINIPNTFVSAGTAIVNGGETQQITDVIAGPGIEVENFKAPLLENDFGSPAGAYSLRQLKEGQPHCIRVQAGSGPTLDIGFALNERGVMALDEGQLLDFANNTTAEIRVNTIYDQSGNDNDLIAGTLGARFKATTDSGSGLRELFRDSAGNPVLRGTGSDDFYNFTSALSISENYSWLAVSGGGFVSSTRYLGSPSQSGMGITFNDNNQIQFNAGPDQKLLTFSGSNTRSAPHIFFFNSQEDGDELYGYQDNVASTDNPVSTTSFTYPKSIPVGVSPALSSNIYNVSGGNWQEVIIWDNDNNEVNREGIYNHTNFYYRTQAGIPDDSLTISQPPLERPKSTTLSMRELGTNAGDYGKDSIILKDWPYGTQGDISAGKIVYWNATSGIWEETSSSSFNATLLLGMSTGSGGETEIIKRGFVRTNRSFATFAVGQPLFLGIDGEVIGVKPTSANNYVRMVGWAMDTDSTAGLMFFSPDVNFETVA